MEEKPRQQFFFRKRTEQLNDAAKNTLEESYSDEIPDNDDKEHDPEPVPGNGEQTLLLCYKTKPQQRLLQLYGNDICLLDATYIRQRNMPSLSSFSAYVRTSATK